MFHATFVLATLAAVHGGLPQSTLSRLPQTTLKQADPTNSYGDACRESLRTGKPLLVWVGGNFCERCVADSKDEFIHHFAKSFPGVAAPAVVVAAPEGDWLTRVENITWWVEGDATFGHIPSARRALANYRTGAGRVPSPAFQPAAGMGGMLRGGRRGGGGC